MNARTFSLMCLLVSATACANGAKPPVTAQAMTETNSRNTSNAKPDDNPAQSNVRVAENVRKACGLSDEEAYFAFNSAAIRSKDRSIMKKIADCFVAGPLKGDAMRLIGHADPRGSEDYNMALGGRRADSVKRVIVASGLSDNRVTTTSRGAMDATGTDEASWARDRNVDVTVGQ